MSYKIKLRLFSASVLLSLLISLFIYLFYRINETVVYLMATAFFPHLLSTTKIWLHKSLYLPEFIIYNLPEGLWVFTLSLVIGSSIWRYPFFTLLFPLVYTLGLETLQYLHFTDGTFDAMDVATIIIFWILGLGFSSFLNLQLKRKWSLLLIVALFFLVFLSDIQNWN